MAYKFPKPTIRVVEPRESYHIDREANRAYIDVAKDFFSLIRPHSVHKQLKLFSVQFLPGQTSHVGTYVQLHVIPETEITVDAFVHYRCTGREIYDYELLFQYNDRIFNPGTMHPMYLLPRTVNDIPFELRKICEIVAHLSSP